MNPTIFDKGPANMGSDIISIVIIRIKPKEEEPEVPKLPVVLPGSIIVLHSGRMLDVQHLGIDANGMGRFYQGVDIEFPRSGKLELLHIFLEKFGYDQIIVPGEEAEKLRNAFL